jgi:hypothetical protein
MMGDCLGTRPFDYEVSVHCIKPSHMHGSGLESLDVTGAGGGGGGAPTKKNVKWVVPHQI